MPKLTKTEDIVNELVKMKIEKGCSTKTLLEHCYTTYDFKETHSYNLIKAARKKIQEIWDKNAEAHLEEAKGQLEEMLEHALKFGDRRMALQIRQELNKLMGLYTEKIDMTITMEQPLFSPIIKDKDEE